MNCGMCPVKKGKKKTNKLIYCISDERYNLVYTNVHICLLITQSFHCDNYQNKNDDAIVISAIPVYEVSILSRCLFREYLAEDNAVSFLL